MINKIPNHLHRYIVEQNYDNYTQIDQACWRFIMKISSAFFKDNADKTYLKGLKKTGITTDKIPSASIFKVLLLRSRVLILTLEGLSSSS